jgi:hypothetical protein
MLSAFGRLLGLTRHRVKVIPPCGDCHYLYTWSRAGAERVVARLRRQLRGTPVKFFIYAETSYGHIRVDNNGKQT